MCLLGVKPITSWSKVLPFNYHRLIQIRFNKTSQWESRFFVIKSCSNINVSWSSHRVASDKKNIYIVPIEYSIIILEISFENIFYLTCVAKLKRTNRNYYYGTWEIRKSEVYKSYDPKALQEKSKILQVRFRSNC